MKKSLCLFLIVVILLSLVACGKKNNTEPTGESTPETTEATVPDVTEPTSTEHTENIDENEFYQCWEMNPNLKQEIEKISYEEVDVDGNKVKILTTMLNFDATEVLVALQENPYIAKNYQELYSYKEDGHKFITVDENTNYNVVSESEYIMSDLGASAQIKIKTEKIKHYYKTPSEILINFSSSKKELLSQEEIYKVLQITVPKFAEYLVYGKDLDGLDVEGHDLLVESYMEECLTEEDCTYQISRQLLDFGDYFEVEFLVSVKENVHENFETHAFPYESEIYNKTEFTTENIFSENYPKLSPFNYEDFANAMFKDLIPDYQYVKIDEWKCSDYVDVNNVRQSYIALEFTVYDSNNSRTASFGCRITTKSQDNKITYQSLDINTWTYDLLRDDVKKYSELFAEKYELLLDGLDIGEIVVDKEYNNNCSATAVWNRDNIKYEGYLDTHYANTPMMSLRLDYYA